MIKILLIIVLYILAFISAPAQQRPNIIFIMADDLGYGDIEPYGQKIIKTPHLNRMAREGLRFTQHYAGTAVCAPSRYALMTGKHTGRSEIRANRQTDTYGQQPLSASAVTVAEVMKKAGYKTGLIGKWGLGEPGTSGDPLKQGFDFYYGYTDQVLAHNHYPQFLLRNGEKEYLRNQVEYLDSLAWHKGRGSIATKKIDFADHLFTNEAIKFLKENKHNPFFLYLPYIIPHDNGEAPAGEQFESPGHPLYEKQLTGDQKHYASSITYLDEYVGRILDALVTLKIEQNTLVIFTSDNGPKTDDMGFKSSGGLRDIKRSLHEGGIRVPFIAWWPGTIKPNRTTDHISAFWDFLPTAAELGGVTEKLDTDGISLVPTLKGSSTQKLHDYLYFEIHEAGGAIAVRKGDWKGIIKQVKTIPSLPMELYNLKVDPKEKTNLAEGHPDVIKELKDIISKAHTRSEIFRFPFD
jgi:arylsulfatase A